MDQAAIEAALREVVEHATGTTPAASASPVLEHVAHLVAPLTATGSFDDEVWDQVMAIWFVGCIRYDIMNDVASLVVPLAAVGSFGDEVWDQGIATCNSSNNLIYQIYLTLPSASKYLHITPTTSLSVLYSRRPLDFSC